MEAKENARNFDEANSTVESRAVIIRELVERTYSVLNPLRQRAYHFQMIFRRVEITVFAVLIFVRRFSLSLVSSILTSSLFPLSFSRVADQRLRFLLHPPAPPSRQNRSTRPRQPSRRRAPHLPSSPPVIIILLPFSVFTARRCAGAVSRWSRNWVREDVDEDGDDGWEGGGGGEGVLRAGGTEEGGTDEAALGCYAGASFLPYDPSFFSF
jgi:hypothetical protein